jgi:hypothetical protein
MASHMSRGASGWDRATPDAAVVLRDLKREANLVRLGLVLSDFPSSRNVGVVARWRDVLAKPGFTAMLHRLAYTRWVTDGTPSLPRRAPVPASPDIRAHRDAIVGRVLGEPS